MVEHLFNIYHYGQFISWYFFSNRLLVFYLIIHAYRGLLLVSIHAIIIPETASQGGVTRARVHPGSCICVTGSTWDPVYHT